ncbi:MAG: RraA family protein [Betaproteobacteria bacterium]|nr:RraA family protein [Betaproteobacteria bacterium]
MSDDLLARFRALDTTTVSDALDRLGLTGGCVGIVPINHGTRACGYAFTVRYRPRGPGRGSVGDFLDDVTPAHMVVIDNAGRPTGTVWGDIMTVLAVRKGIAGTVIDGACRDLPRIRELRYPIFTRSFSMITGKDRVEVESVNEPVSIANEHVAPGDIMLADDTGVVRIPRDHATRVLEVAQEIEEAERRILEAIEQGASLREARARFGYHGLQTKR